MSSEGTGGANNPSHAYVRNGRIHLLQGGQFWETPEREAFWEWFGIHDREHPETKERARQIRAALDEVRNEQH